MSEPYGAPGQRAVLDAYGAEPLAAVQGHLRLEVQDPPDPAGLGPGDAVVAVEAAAVGWVDLLMASGQYQHRLQPPYTPGLEYSGVVAWAGPESGRRVGERVLADPFRTGPRSLGEYQGWGGFASWAVAPGAGLVPLPAPLSFAEGACLLGGFETAYYVLVTRGGLQAGETLLVHGASGSTGLAAVQLAKRLGATVIASGRSTFKLAQVHAAGADHVLVTADGEGGVRRFRDEVKELTGGAGADVVWDGVGGEVSLETLRCLRFGARYLIVGWAATPLVARRGAPPNHLPTNLILMKGLEVRGCPAAIATHHDPALREERLARILAWVEAGELAPRVDRTYPLSQVQEALEAKWRSQAVGNLVLRPAQSPPP